MLHPILSITINPIGLRHPVFLPRGRLTTAILPRGRLAAAILIPVLQPFLAFPLRPAGVRIPGLVSSMAVNSWQLRNLRIVPILIFKFSVPLVFICPNSPGSRRVGAFVSKVYFPYRGRPENKRLMLTLSSSIQFSATPWFHNKIYCYKF